MGPIKIIWSIEFSWFRSFWFRFTKKSLAWPQALSCPVFGLGAQTQFGLALGALPPWYNLTHRQRWRPYLWWGWPLIISDLFDRMMEFPVIFDRWCVGNIIVPDGQSGRSIRSVCSHSEEDGREGRSSLLHSAFVVQHFVSSAVLEMNASPSSGKKQIRLGQMEQFCPEIWPRSTGTA